ncbi:MAG: redoxin domain-containing protein [Candidatus Omnitrophota bacterium]
MKKFLASFQRVLVSLITAACFAAPGEAEMPLEPLRKAPEISGPVWFNVESFPRISIKSLRGDVILVVFWSSTDVYSRKAMEYINDWYARYQDKGFVVIGVHSMDWGFDMSEPTVEKEIKYLNIKFPVFLDIEGKAGMAYDQTSRPSLFLIDRKGYVRGEYKFGFSWENVHTLLRHLLEEGSSRLLDQL